MNISRSAWNTLHHTVATLVRVLVAPGRLILSGYLAERARCRAIADLERLPRTVLKDIGVHRVAIPLVVAEASRVQREPVHGTAAMEAAELAQASPDAADAGRTASHTSIA